MSKSPWRVYPGSRLEKLPKFFLIFLLPLRWLIIKLSPSRYFTENFYSGEGITSVHNSSFLLEEDFKESYSSACASAGWDYEIPWRIHVAIWAAHSCLNLPGDFVELGTGRGFLMTAVLNSVKELGGERRVFLLDSYEPFEPSLNSGDQDSGKISPHYAVSFEMTRKNFEHIASVELIKGKLPESIAQLPSKEIAFLHIDLNHHIVEIASLRLLWSRLSQGAIILLDDYANLGREIQYQAFNKLGKELDTKILTLPTGQGMLIKK